MRTKLFIVGIKICPLTFTTGTFTLPGFRFASLETGETRMVSNKGVLKTLVRHKSIFAYFIHMIATLIVWLFQKLTY